jgi:TetR/AcrR family transcriptional regulator, regulator of biofilm formation and stress response
MTRTPRANQTLGGPGALEERMSSAPDTQAALDALAHHRAQNLLGDERTLLLAFELYVAAARRRCVR